MRREKTDAMKDRIIKYLTESMVKEILLVQASRHADVRDADPLGVLPKSINQFPENICALGRNWGPLVAGRNSIMG
jgi:hypothetical protein